MTQQIIDLDETVLEAAGIARRPDPGFPDGAARNALRETSTGCHNTGIHHVGLHASNPTASAEFYRDVLGMEIVGGSAADHPLGASAFLSSRPDEESHQIALFANPAFAHAAFKVSSLAELRSMHARVVEKNIRIRFAANHGVSLAFYFEDPDGNLIEVYWPTGDLSWSQPHMQPLDLSQPDEVLLKGVTAAPAPTVAGAGGGNGTGLRGKQFKYVPAGTGPAYCGPGDQIAFLITGAETGGAFFMAEVSVVPGGGPPPHVHSREDESFYLQQGTLAVQVGGQTLNVSAGDFVHMPRGVAHSFRNVSEETARLVMTVTPAGLENYFAETFFPAADIAGIPDIGPAVIARARKTAPQYGLELLPQFSLSQGAVRRNVTT